LASFVASIILTKVGRKVILQIGTLLAAVTLVMVALGFSLKDSSSIISNSSYLLIYLWSAITLIFDQKIYKINNKEYKKLDI
jgi:hypothetical protein